METFLEDAKLRFAEKEKRNNVRRTCCDTRTTLLTRIVPILRKKTSIRIAKILRAREKYDYSRLLCLSIVVDYGLFIIRAKIALVE